MQLSLLSLAWLLVGVSAQSQPNPIASQYPSQTTGTLNETISLLPIPYSLARKLVPSQYNILTANYKYLEQTAGFPAGYYPLVMECGQDHGDTAYSLLTLPDISSTRISFPFVDLLGDGKSQFRYIPTIWLPAPETLPLTSATAAGLAIIEALAYKQKVIASTFSPSNTAYAYVAGSSSEIYFDVNPVTSVTDIINLSVGTYTPITTTFSPATGTTSKPLPPVSFFENVIEQPVFGAPGGSCDNFIRFYNTSITTGVYAPQLYQGNVVIDLVTPVESYPNMAFTGVYALKLDEAYIDNSMVACSTLAGYSTAS